MEDRFRMEMRKKFFTMKVVQHWNRLPRDAVDAHHWKCSTSGWMGL